MAEWPQWPWRRCPPATARDHQRTVWGHQRVGRDGTGSPSRVGANVRVSHDRYRVHVEPSVAVNPRDPRQLLAACQVSPTRPPSSSQPTSRSTEVRAGRTVACHRCQRRGEGRRRRDCRLRWTRPRLCLRHASHAPQPRQPRRHRAIYVWRTDDGGRSFSAPVTLLEGQYCDHPWLATGQGQTPSGHNVYVAWGAGDSQTALDLTRSTTAARASSRRAESWRRPASRSPESAGPELAAGPNGLVCAVCDWTTLPDSSGDMIGQVVAVCSTDAGHSFAAPVHLGSGSSVIELPGDVRPNSSPAVAVSPHGDVLYVAFPTHQPGATHSDIVVTASHDRGRTWSKAVTATPDDGVIYFQPNLAVDEAGRVAISAFALANGRVDEVLLVSQPRKLRFRPTAAGDHRSLRPARRDDGLPREARRLVDRRLSGHRQQRWSLPSRVERHPHGKAGSLRGHGAPMTPEPET